MNPPPPDAPSPVKDLPCVPSSRMRLAHQLMEPEPSFLHVASMYNGAGDVQDTQEEDCRSALELLADVEVPREIEPWYEQLPLEGKLEVKRRISYALLAVRK